MPITNTWMYGNRVIHQKYIGTVTGKQITDSLNELRLMVEQGQTPVHVFVDASTQNNQTEIGLGDLKSLVPKVLDGVGWTVVVQPHSIQRFFISLGMQISGGKYKFLKDEAEAIQFLVEHDPTLRDVIR